MMEKASNNPNQTQDTDDPAVGADQVEEAANGGRFLSVVKTKKADNLASKLFQVYAVEGFDLPMGFHHITCNYRNRIIHNNFPEIFKCYYYNPQNSVTDQILNVVSSIQSQSGESIILSKACRYHYSWGLTIG
jgi:hypothetical protein